MFLGNFFIFAFETSDSLMHFTFYCFLLQERVGQASNELSGDLDTPEGGFDGLMQATMCEQVKLVFFGRWLSRGNITNGTKYSKMEQVKFLKGVFCGPKYASEMYLQFAARRQSKHRLKALNLVNSSTFSVFVSLTLN